MRSTKFLLAFGFMAAAATALSDGAQARRFVAGGGAVHISHLSGGVRPGWHGGGTRWAGGRYYRGGYYGAGWGRPAAAGVAAGAALGAAAAYGSSCYQTQNVWNGYTYVQRAIYVC